MRRLHRRLVRALEREAASSPGEVDVVDLFDDLAQAYRRFGSALVAPRGHWSDAGNCRIALRLAHHLAERRPDLFVERADARSCPPGD